MINTTDQHSGNHTTHRGAIGQRSLPTLPGNHGRQARHTPRGVGAEVAQVKTGGPRNRSLLLPVARAAVRESPVDSSPDSIQAAMLPADAVGQVAVDGRSQTLQSMTSPGPMSPMRKCKT
jgi:hypothetical protein